MRGSSVRAFVDAAKGRPLAASRITPQATEGNEVMIRICAMSFSGDDCNPETLKTLLGTTTASLNRPERNDDQKMIENARPALVQTNGQATAK